MSLYPCSVHGERVPRKLGTVFCRWHNADGEFVGWKMRICAACLTDLRASLLGHLSEASSLLTACPTCGQDSSQSLNPTYLFVYPPKQPPVELALTTCDSCATKWHASFEGFGEQLPDREVRVGAETPTSTDDWGSWPV
jgi:hypothetical protein